MLALDVRVRRDSAQSTSVQDTTLDAVDLSALITPSGTTVLDSSPEKSLSAPKDATKKEKKRCVKWPCLPFAAVDALALLLPAAEVRSRLDKDTEDLKERRNTTREEIQCSSEFKYLIPLIF